MVVPGYAFHRVHQNGDWHRGRSRHRLKNSLTINDRYNGSLYTEERIWVYAPDGMRVPSTYVYRRDTPFDATRPRPIMLSAYGAYGDAYGPTFQSWNLVYLDRGIAYAGTRSLLSFFAQSIHFRTPPFLEVHVRGSSYRGALWYTEGRVLHKRRTFDDFIATAEYLVRSRRTHPSMMAFYGRSAGGLLMGAVLTQRPDLCVVMWAGVPFVDALNTMSDPTITYVVYEYPEWGNPMENRLFYESTVPLLFHALTFHTDMRSYDPYWNVRETAYPNLLVQTGLSDLLVNYWEPTKLVAKLRAMRTNSEGTRHIRQATRFTPPSSH